MRPTLSSVRRISSAAKISTRSGGTAAVTAMDRPASIPALVTTCSPTYIRNASAAPNARRPDLPPRMFRSALQKARRAAHTRSTTSGNREAAPEFRSFGLRPDRFVGAVFDAAQQFTHAETRNGQVVQRDAAIPRRLPVRGRVRLDDGRSSVGAYCLRQTFCELPIGGVDDFGGSRRAGTSVRRVSSENVNTRMPLGPPASSSAATLTNVSPVRIQKPLPRSRLPVARGLVHAQQTCLQMQRPCGDFDGGDHEHEPRRQRIRPSRPRRVPETPAARSAISSLLR